MSSTTPHLESLIIRAGAGAGKTTRLTRHVLSVANSFYQEHQRWPKMVVSTFTRKATQELRERLISLCAQPDHQHMIPFVTSTSRLHISTIHGVLSLFLRRYGHLVGMDNSFSIMDERAGLFLAKKILSQLSMEDDAWLPFIEQYGNHGLAKILRKYSEASLVWGDIAPHSMASYNKAYQSLFNSLGLELLSISKGILSEGDEKWIEFAKSLETFAVLLKKPPPIKEVEEAFDALPAKPRVSKTTSEVIKNYSDAFQEIKKTLQKYIQDPAFSKESWEDMVERTNLFEELAQQFSEEFLVQKLDSGMLEMSDLEGFAGKVIREEPELAAEFSKDWDYWMIDEFQDTSPAQSLLLDQLIGSSPRFVVGDPQQSIYLFRGARSEVFLEKEKQFKDKKWNTDLLMKNYRSQGSLLEGINSLVMNISSGQFNRMQPRESQEPTDVRITWAKANHAEEGHSEKDYILWQIETLKKIGAQFRDICILGRDHKTLADIAIYLKQHSIPVTVHGGASYQLKQEVLEAKSLLHFLLNPQNNKALLTLLRSPWFFVEDQLIIDHVHSQKRPYWYLFKEKLSEHPSIQQLQSYITELPLQGYYEIFKKALLESGMLTATHLYDSTGKREANIWKLLLSVKEQEIQTGFSFYNFINDSHIALDEESLGQDGEASSPLDDNRVQMMTVHASKGLQFKHVIVPSCHKKPNLSQSALEFDHFVFDEFNKSWGLSHSLDGKKQSLSIADKSYVLSLQEREQKESERVFYVAITRAIESLHFSEAKKPTNYSWSLLLEKSHQVFESHSTFEVLRGPWERQGLQTEAVSESSYYPLDIQPQPSPWKKVSVSTLLEGIQVNSSSNFSPEPEFESILKPINGVHLHSVFERLKYDTNFDFASYCRKWIGADSSANFISGVSWALNCSEIPFKKILETGFVEWGYQYLENQKIVEGQVDLWGAVDNTCYIVDYKTGSPNFTDKAFLQLQQYAKAIQTLHSYSQIKLVVMFPLKQSLFIRPFQ